MSRFRPLVSVPADLLLAILSQIRNRIPAFCGGIAVAAQRGRIAFDRAWQPFGYSSLPPRL